MRYAATIPHRLCLHILTTHNDDRTTKTSTRSPNTVDSTRPTALQTTAPAPRRAPPPDPVTLLTCLLGGPLQTSLGGPQRRVEVLQVREQGPLRRAAHAAAGGGQVVLGGRPPAVDPRRPRAAGPWRRPRAAGPWRRRQPPQLDPVRGAVVLMLVRRRSLAALPWVMVPSEELERGRGESSSWPLLDSSSVLWFPSDSLKHGGQREGEPVKTTL